MEVSLYSPTCQCKWQRSDLVCANSTVSASGSSSKAALPVVMPMPAKQPCLRRLAVPKVPAQGTHSTMATNINYADTMPYTAPPRPTPTPEEQTESQELARREAYRQHWQQQVDTFGSMYRLPSSQYNIRWCGNISLTQVQTRVQPLLQPRVQT